MIDVDDDDDDYIDNDDAKDDKELEDDDLELKPRGTKRTRAPSASPKKKETVVKEPPVKKAKTPAPKKRAPALTSASAGGESAAEKVLATIPDAILPEVDPSKKVNFFALQAAKDNASQPTGNIDIPEAQPNCLGGLTIVFTGILPNLERTQAENLAKKYGARVTKSISGKTSLVVLGDDAGPSKVQKISALKIKAINEEGFILLLSMMPADGGDGAAAQKAKQLREEEDRKIMEQVERDVALEEEKKREQEQKLIEHRKEEAKRAKAKVISPSIKSEGLEENQFMSHGSFPDSHLPKDEPKIILEEDKLWTTKYKPTDIRSLCGNKGSVNKLQHWLSNWFESRKGPGNENDGLKYRAVLISGPPGIGKTTAAHIVSKQLGYDILEKNASDVRSKSLLNQQVKSVLNNTSVVGFFKHRNDEVEDKNAKKFVLIMDEVDGMSSGDHGGVGALAAFCKVTKMPLILICNERTLPKMRPLLTCTFGLRFQRPLEKDVISKLFTIAMREGIKMDKEIVGQLVQATGGDIRQMINLMYTVSRTQKQFGQAEATKASKQWGKETILKPFDIVPSFLGNRIWHEGSNHNLNAKLEMYFNDMDIVPLMIQDNYLGCRPANAVSEKDALKRIAKASDDILRSDRVNSLIRSSEQQWSLLPFHAILSTIAPSYEVHGQFGLRIFFPSWLGQNSKAMKFLRLLQSVQYHTRTCTTSEKMELRLEYIPLMAHRLVDPLIEQGESGIESVIGFMDSYYLNKEDWDSIVELGVGRNKDSELVKGLKTAVKSKFTRKYNESTHPTIIYKTGDSVSKGGAKAAKVDFEDVVEDDTSNDKGDEKDSEQPTDVTKDKQIGIKVKTHEQYLKEQARKAKKREKEAKAKK